MIAVLEWILADLFNWWVAVSFFVLLAFAGDMLSKRGEK